MATLLKFLKLPLLVIVYTFLIIIRADTLRTWTLDDFEDDDLKAASGLSWIVISDDLAGGTTEYRLDVGSTDEASSRRALRLAGRLGGGGMSFAGAWVPLERTGRNLDLRAFEGVRLRVKGPARLDVGFRSGAVNFMARVDAGPEWRLVEIPFAQLAPVGKVPDGTRWNAGALQVFGVTTPQAPAGDDRTTGDFAFEVDDVGVLRGGHRPHRADRFGPVNWPHRRAIREALRHPVQRLDRSGIRSGTRRQDAVTA